MKRTTLPSECGRLVARIHRSAQASDTPLRLLTSSGIAALESNQICLEPRYTTLRRWSSRQGACETTCTTLTIRPRTVDYLLSAGPFRPYPKILIGTAPNWQHSRLRYALLNALSFYFGSDIARPMRVSTDGDMSNTQALRSIHSWAEHFEYNVKRYPNTVKD